MMSRIIGKYGALGSILFLLAIRIPFDFKPFHNVDEGVLATLANIISTGGLVYRDGWCHRGPLLGYVYAAIFGLFGRNNMAAVHLTTTLVIAAESFLLYRFTRFFFENRVAIAATFLFAFFSTFGYPPYDTLASNVEIWMNLFILSSLNVFMKALKTDLRCHYFLTGLIMGFAALTKQVAYFLYPFLILALWFAPVWGKEEKRKPVQTAAIGSLIIALGMLTPLIGFLVYYALKGAMGDFLSLYFSYNFYYLGSFYEQSIDFNLLGRAAIALRNMVNINFSPSGPLLLYGFSLVGFIAYLWGLIHPDRKSSDRPFPQLLFFFIWLFFSILPLFVLGRAFGHYFIQVLPVVSIIAAVFIIHLFQKGVRKPLGRSALAIPILFFLIYPAYRFMNEGPLQKNRLLDEVARYIQNRSSPKDSIFLWGWETELYVVANRPNASRFIFCSFLTDQTPGGIKGRQKDGNLGYRNAVDLWNEDLHKRRPKFIVDSHQGHYFYVDYPLTRYPAIWHFIENNYRIVHVINTYVIYERVGR